MQSSGGALILGLQWSLRPENTKYRYDYYRDNCTTRVRDVIDRAVDGEIGRQLKSVRTDMTFRSYTRTWHGGVFLALYGA